MSGQASSALAAAISFSSRGRRDSLRDSVSFRVDLAKGPAWQKIILTERSL